MSNSTYLHCICAVELSSYFSSITQFNVNFFPRVKPYIKAPYMFLFIFQQDELNLTLLLATWAGKMESSCPLGNTYGVPPRIKQTLELNFHKIFNAYLKRKSFFRGQSIFSDL